MKTIVAIFLVVLLGRCTNGTSERVAYVDSVCRSYLVTKDLEFDEFNVFDRCGHWVRRPFDGLGFAANPGFYDFWVRVEGSPPEFVR